jgi:radical SAM superfamily enzyme YgiQ (UPF0313 family)
MKTRQPGPILLISTYELGHQPLNLASPLAFLERAGFVAQAVDASVQTLSRPAIEEAWFIGISVPMHTATRLALQLIEQIRAINPQIHLCCYGLYAPLNAGSLLEYGVDYMIGGEYEQPLLNLVTALSRGEAAPPEGITTRQNLARPYLAKLPFAVPDRKTLPPLKHYAHLAWNGRQALAGYVEASRGCLHTCRHCPITPVYQGRFFVLPREVVLADIRAQVAIGATHITFGDPDFLNGPGHSLKILRAMHGEFPHLTFDITTKIEHILEFRRHFAELSALGCAFVVSAVESFSDRVLAQLDKGHSRADIYTALDILAEAGIPMRPSLLPFTPWTTVDDYLDMLEQVERLGLIDHIDPVQYSIRLLVPPGSALIEQPGAEAWLGPLNAEGLTYTWQHPDPRMDTLQRQVSQWVAGAAQAGADARTTFYRVQALAYATALGRLASPPTPAPLSPAPPGSSPKLTEAWFC